MKIRKNISSIKKNCLNSDKKLSDAIFLIKKIKQKIIFIIKSNKLIGTITDGDIRGSHFKNYSENPPVIEVMNHKPKYVFQKYKQSDLNKIDSKKTRYLPVLNYQRKIVKILDLQMEKIKNYKHENHIVIFAGGFGKRLRPFTKKVPKPMLKIKNRPNLEILVENILKQGFKNINISLHYKHNYIIKKLKRTNNFYKVNFNIEKKPLGTAGALSAIKFRNKLPIIAINADLITNLDLNNLLFNHNSSKSDFTVSVKKRYFKVPFAIVDIKKNKISSIEEKPSKGFFFNAGIYMINNKVLKNMKRNKKIDMPDLIQNSIRRKYSVNAFYMYEDWVDYGSKETFLKLKKKYEHKSD